jgi:hypothetical protein
MSYRHGRDPDDRKSIFPVVLQLTVSVSVNADNLLMSKSMTARKGANRAADHGRQTFADNY